MPLAVAGANLFLDDSSSVITSVAIAICRERLDIPDMLMIDLWQHDGHSFGSSTIAIISINQRDRRTMMMHL